MPGALLKARRYLERRITKKMAVRKQFLRTVTKFCLIGKAIKARHAGAGRAIFRQGEYIYGKEGMDS